MMWQDTAAIADALLYEGYLLYPYRGSALKNRFRWQFGIIAPKAYSAGGGSEPSMMRTECLIENAAGSSLAVKLRFLHVLARSVQQAADASGDWQTVERVVLDGREVTSWDEAAPQEIMIPEFDVDADVEPVTFDFEIAGSVDCESLDAGADTPPTRIVRERLPLACRVTLAVEAAGHYSRVRVSVENVTPWMVRPESDRTEALRRSLIAAHALLAVRGGAFVSMTDPPSAAAEAIAGCRNLNTWPVLIGRAPQRNLMLSAPIILDDYPKIAPESPGDLFDGTEIDELLTLRVLTLTEDERRQAQATDPHAARILDRAAQLGPEQLARLHGATRSLSMQGPPRNADILEAWLNPPVDTLAEVSDAQGRRIAVGDRVRLVPRRRADAIDMFLAGEMATVAAVCHDLEDDAHIAVIVDAGRAADIHQSNGRFFYFRPDEVEIVEAGSGAGDAPRAASARVLVAGIGNMFLGDDGFGPAVVERLAGRSLPEQVHVEDYGIRSVHLAYELLGNEYDTAILIDALPRGGAAGTLYVLEPDVDDVVGATPDAHSLSVEGVLGTVRAMGGAPGRVLIVGCEPASVEPGIGLSAAVAHAVEHAAQMVVGLIHGEGAG